MVQINPILAQEGINPGSVPSTARDTSVGRAVEGFGASIGQLGAVLQEHKNAVDRFNTNQEFQRFQSDNALSFSKRQENIDPSGQGLTKSVIQDYDQRSKQFLSLVPDGLKPQYAQLVATAKEQWLNKASAAELDQRNDWYRTGITKTTTGLQNQVFDDPSHYQGALDEGNRTIDASGLPPVEKQKLKDAWKETLATTLGQREARDALNDPQSAIGAAGRLGVGGAATSKIAQAAGMEGVNPTVALGIAKIESGFNPNAKSKTSSATGTFQITSGTASDLGIDPNDPNQNILGGVRLIKQNTDALKAATGQEPSPGDVYLAHFLGIGAAEKIVGADLGMPISNYVSDGAVAANRSILEGKTVGQVRQWAQQKMASAMDGGASGVTDVPTNPAYADLPLSKRLEIYDNIQSSAQKGLSALQAQQKTAYDNQMGQMKLGIETGQVNSPQTIMGASWMKDGDKATLLHQLNEQLKTNGAISAHIAAVSAGSDAAKVNPFDSEDRSLDNKAFAQVIKTVPPEQVQPVAENWVKTTGNIPDQITASIRQDLSSQNVANVAQGMAEASKLFQVASSAFDAIPNGNDLKKAALAYNQYVYDRGLSDQEAGTRWMNANSPEAIQQREQLKKPAADFVKTLSITDVTSALNTGVPILGRPNAGLTPEQQAAVMSDYTKIANEDFLKAGGDADLAKTLALADMKKLYGVSDVSGSKTIMKFPPENYYPQVNGGWDYIREAAMAQAKADVSGQAPILSEAAQKYPILSGYDIPVVQSDKKQGDDRVLESWPPNEPGTSDDPRPKGIPIDKFGVQLFGNVSPRDVAADVVSHDLVNANPKLKPEYQTFVETFSTPEGQARLREDYQWAQQNENETRPFDQWARQTRIPAYFRGYVFDQWSGKAKAAMFTTDQRAILNRMKSIIEAPAANDENIVQNVMLRPSKETADDIKTNHPPRYQLWYQRPDGTWDQDAAKPLFNVNPDWINGTLGKQRDQRIQKAQELHDAATAYQNRPPQTVDTTSQATMSNSALTNAVNAWAPVPGMKQPTPQPAPPRKAVPPAAPSDAARTNATMMNFMNGWAGSAPLQQEQGLEKSGARF